MQKHRQKKLTLFRRATNKRITRKTQRATTYRIVINDLASCVLAACARHTRIHALLIDARFVQETLGANGAFGPTRGRIADAVLDARADRMAIGLSALAVWAARRRCAWILFGYRSFMDDGDGHKGNIDYTI